MMPAWNVASYIEEAIQSCQDQTYQNWELCIVDDGSTDDTYELALKASFQDTRIRVEKQHHQGCPSTRNACLRMATGDIIARQDADDTQDANRLERQVQYLLDYDSIDIVTCRMYWFKNNQLLPRSAGRMDVDAYMHGRSSGPVCASIMAWKYVYDRVGEYNPSLLAGSDGDWNFRAILAEMKWGFIDEPLYIYRRHPGQITWRLSREQRATHEASRKKYLELWRANE